MTSIAALPAPPLADTPLGRTIAATATDIWNDSCSIPELEYAISYGAVGATANPTIVTDVWKQEPGRWRDRIRALAAERREATERDLAWAVVEAEMLRRHVSRRLSDRLNGIDHGPDGSVDKLLMTQVEQTIGHAAASIGGIGYDGDDTWLKVYLYSRAQSVMGGTSQIQRNLVAQRILGLPAS